MNRMKKFMAMLLVAVLVTQSGFTAFADQSAEQPPAASEEEPAAEEPAVEPTAEEPAEEPAATEEKGPTEEPAGDQGQVATEEPADNVEPVEEPAATEEKGPTEEPAGDQEQVVEDQESGSIVNSSSETVSSKDFLTDENSNDESVVDKNINEDTDVNPNISDELINNAEVLESEVVDPSLTTTFSEEPRIESVIVASMTQDEIDSVLADSSEITVEAGDYSTQINNQNYHKIIRLDQGQTLNMSGDYTRLQIIVCSENAAINLNNVTMNGQVREVSNQTSAIYLQTGSLLLNGNITIDNYDYGICMGYTNAGVDEKAELNVSPGSIVNITNCRYADDNSYYGNAIDDPGNDRFSYVDHQGDGTRGSAITTKGRGYTTINIGEGASLNCTGCSGAGIFSINVSNFTLNVGKDSQVHLDNNGQGLCMNTDYTSTCNVNLNENSILTCNENTSNGITGQNRPYIINAKGKSNISVSNNGGIGINNFYIILDDSNLTAVNNKSHGVTNVALDEYNGSSVTCSNNAYIGLNITKFNDGKNSTNIENSTLIAENNGGPGIRFHVAITAEESAEDTISSLPETTEVNISDSTVTAMGNGIGTSIYGYAVKPGDSGYWADICASCTVNSKGSYITCDSAYSLYNRGSQRASSILSIGEGDVVKLGLNGSEGKGSQTVESGYVIYNDNASTCVGRTYVVNGSLNAYRLAMSGAEEFASLNPSLRSGIQSRSIQITGNVYAAPVNYFGTKLTMFKLSGEGDFTTYDPNENDTYTYSYVSDENGDSYVWAPVAVVHYDATEGNMKITSEDSVQTGDSFVNKADGTQIGCAATDIEKGYEASDYTISGQSISLMGSSLPMAERENYTFSGWYMVDDDVVEVAERYAAAGNYKELYKLLTVKFDENTVIEESDSEITVYAKWSRHYGPDENPEGFDVNISKTAEELNADDETTVQLNVGSTEAQNKVAVLFVLDYSTSVGVRDEAAAMLEELASKDKTDVKVGVINYWAEADTGEWTTITSDTDVNSLLAKTQTGGTNYHAGLLSAQKLLQSDEIDGYTTYLITISDGITYLWTDETTGDTMSVWFQNIGNGPNDIQNGNSVYDMKYHGDPMSDDVLSALVNGSSDIVSKYDNTITRAEVYGSQKPSPSETSRYWALEEDGVMDKTLIGSEIAIYKTASAYRELVETVDYAFAFKLDENHWGNYPYGQQLMDYLISQAGGGEISESTAQTTFNKIKNQILYAINSGTVTDVIGNDFDLKSVDTFKLTVGATELQGTIDSENANLVNFGTADENGVYPYTVEYMPGEAGAEQFVWTINVPVENANGLTLSYVLKLVNKNTAAGTYGQYDKDGSQGYEGIQTNESANLEYETTEGDTGSKIFPKPTVTYTVEEEPAPVVPTPGTATFTITKKVLSADGNAMKVNRSFYAAIFTDAQYQNRYGDVIELKLADASEVSVTVTVETPADGSGRTYYVMETDQNGNVVTSGNDFGYYVDVKGSEITASKTANKADIVITNQAVRTSGGGSGSSGGSSSGSGSSGSGSSSTPQTVASSQTGDTTNVTLYIVLFAVAAAALCACGVVVYKKKKLTK